MQGTGLDPVGHRIFGLTDIAIGPQAGDDARTRFCVRLFRFQEAADVETTSDTRLAPERWPEVSAPQPQRRSRIGRGGER